ncbi:MAG: efflux RND transporter permease subunit [Cyanobacteria bacterium P01_A01_bin.15]
MADFFIKRPVFTIVTALIILLIGGISVPTLPIAQFPDIAPKQVNVTANYSGASATAVENGVTSLIEREINGVQGMRYVSSSSSNSGTSSISITFDASRDQDIAAVDIQNRVSVAETRLPEEVTRTGITIAKQSGSILLGFGLFSEEDEYDSTFLSNYADLYLVDALKRIDGVEDAQIFGERRYAMRLWLDPDRLASRGLTSEDVSTAIRQQNIQVAAGRLGQQPAEENQQYQIDLEAISRLENVSEFENITVATDEDGSLVKVRDVGRVELGAQDYSSFLRYNGKDGSGVGIYQVPGSNALDVSKNVRAEMKRLSEQFPPGMTYAVGFDTTEYVNASLSQVFWALIQAIGLVILVIFVFLQDWRTAVVPAISIPVSLIGTFAFVNVFGFSINSLTLFGLILATGIVVDDAIVVVEDVTAKIQSKSMKPRRAAIVAMRELTGAVIATSLVLMAVFVPVAFFPGTTGALYRQFALTIAFAVAISTFNAITLTPMLCGLLLRREKNTDGWLGKVFDKFNQGLTWLENRYEQSLQWLTGVKYWVIGCFVVLLFATAWLYTTVPSAFLPEEDQGEFTTIVQGPEGVSLTYTSDVMSQAEEILLAQPEIRTTFAIGGFSFSGSAANSGVIFVTLTPWGDRDRTAMKLVSDLEGELGSLTDARIFPVNPPALQGLGSFGGFTFQLQDRQGDLELDQFVGYKEELISAANQHPKLQQVFSTYAASTPKIEIEVDRERASSLQVSPDQIFSALQSYMGAQFVNEFNLGRRTYRVYIQADRQFRAKPEDINQIYVRSDLGEMIPLGNLVTLTPAIGAQTINHYNLFRSIEITGSPAEGASSGEALTAMEDVAAEVLPPSLGYEWSGASLEEKTSGGQAPFIFGFGLVLVFLVLAAQYESFTDPTIIMLSVPLAVMGALMAQSLRGLSNDVYCQIGLVMLIGLSSKNAILIVEFANQKREEDGVSLTQAALAAAKQRMRPIIMTAISTLSSIFPLVIASGAGAGSRQSLGTAVFGGMLIATFLSLFVVPILYMVIKPIVADLMPDREDDDDRLPPGNQMMHGGRRKHQNDPLDTQLAGQRNS